MARGKYEYWKTQDGLTLLEGWARDGLDYAQIAHNVGVSLSTLSEWRKAHPEISEALKKGREVVDYEVENSLLRLAEGYEYDEERLVDGEVIKIKKVVPPNVTAQIFWLKNRRPDKWRDKPDDQKGIAGDQTIENDGLSKSLREMAEGLESDD